MYKRQTEEGRWKLHLPNARIIARGAEPLLFDLREDPLEQRPIKDEAISARLSSKLAAWTARYEREVESLSIDEQRQLLLQMGYVGLAEDLTEEMSLKEKQRRLKLEKDQRKAGRSQQATEKD